jgi:polyisoprenoid-binding protein YceI
MSLRTPFLVLGFAATFALATAFLAPAQDTKPAAGAPAGTYAVDPVHSTVIFQVKHMNTSWSFGRFNKMEGRIVLADAPEKSSVELTIDVGSIDTANDKRDEHLKSPDFFDAVQFPKATFKSKTVAKRDKVWAVSGDLSLHGVTKPVTIEMEQTGTGPGFDGGQLVGFYGKLALERSDYGMKDMLEAVGDDVTLILSVEAAKK